MATYYGYVNREADSYVNWAEAANSVTDMLDAEQKKREEKKAAIEDEFRKSYLDLSNNPMGQSQTLNQSSLKLAGQAQSWMLNLQKQLKSGKIRLDDYLTRKQNLIDNTVGIYASLKEYAESSKEVYERTQKDLNNPLETLMYENVEGIMNFDKSYWLIDDNGAIWTAPKELRNIDGKDVFVVPDTPSGEKQSWLNVKKGLSYRADKYDLDGRTSELAKMMGKNVNTYIQENATAYKNGYLTKEDNIKAREGFKEMERNLIEGELVDPKDVYYVLAKSKGYAPNGKPYTTTYDEVEAANDESKVLLRRNGDFFIPDFETENGKKQKQVAFGVVKDNLNMKYDYEKTMTSIPQLDNTAFKEKIEEKKLANDTRETTARVGLMGAQTRQADASANLYNAQAQGGVTPPDGGTYDRTAYNNFLNQKVTPNLIVDDVERTASNIEGALQGTGFRAVGVTQGGKSMVKIYGVGSSNKEFDIDNPNVLQNIKTWLADPDNISETKIKALVKPLNQ